MTERQKTLLIGLVVWLLVFLGIGLLGGAGTVELWIWLAGTVVLLVAMFTWGRHSPSKT